MLTWPHAQSDWVADLDAIEAIYIAIAREISAHERVLIACHDEDHRTSVRRQLATASTNMQRVALHVAASNDTWARDHGPITVNINDEWRLLDFRFNGWGEKYPHALDNAITECLHKAAAFGDTRLETIDLVLEGGSIEVDGEGTLLTTTRCLLAPNRNPGLDQRELEDRLRQWLGAERILWLQHGAIPGDDTDGHIDTLARFCDAHTIAYVTSEQPQDTGYVELRAMARENGHRAVQIVEQQRPDLVILDLSLKNSHGLDLIGQVRTRSPSTHVLILSMFDETVYAERCLRAGADGYIQKQDEVDKILEGVRTVLAGGLHISEELSSRILRRVVDHRTGSEESKIASLSNRELQLLELIGRGMTTQEIADILNLSTKTIHTYREHLKEKLDVDNVHQLVRYAVLWVLGKER